MINTLSEKEFKETFGERMINVTKTAEPAVDIWSYVEELVKEGVVNDYVLKNTLVEAVYRNEFSSFDHVLLPTVDRNVFVVIVVNTGKEKIYGHYQLDLGKEYSLK